MDSTIPSSTSYVSRLLASALLALLLSACGGTGDSDALLVDYQRALAERLDMTAPTPRSPDNIGAFPEPRERLLAIPETREGLLNVYALRQCHIATLVAERNSALGRVAPASQRWRYELTLWERLDACLDSEAGERLGEADRERLVRLTATKAAQLPKASWNGLFGSEEWAGNFSRVSSPLSPDALAPPPAQLAALVYLHDLTRHALTPDQRPDLEALESHLKALRGRPYSAELLRTLVLAEQRLGEASVLLERTLARHDGCLLAADFPARLEEGPEARRLDAWLEELHAAARSWLTGVDRLLEAQTVGTEAVEAYRRRWLALDQPPAPLPAFEAALAHHQALRQRLAERCR